MRCRLVQLTALPVISSFLRFRATLAMLMVVRVVVSFLLLGRASEMLFKVTQACVC